MLHPKSNEVLFNSINLNSLHLVHINSVKFKYIEKELRHGSGLSSNEDMKVLEMKGKIVA